MKALLLTEYKKLELTDIPVPQIGPEEVLIRVRACGICGSDVHGFDGSTGRRIRLLSWATRHPVSLRRLGSAVKNLAAGRQSCIRFHDFLRQVSVLPAWTYEPLRQPPGARSLAAANIAGTAPLRNMSLCPQHIVFKLPDSLSFEHAAMIEPVSVAVHAVSITPVRLGDTALVVGTGMIGLLTIQAARLAGCSRIIAMDLEDYKLDVAKQHGADEVVNPRKTDVVKYVLESTGGRGVDVSFEAVGATDPIRTAIASTKKGGTVTLIGNIRPEIELPLQSIVTREIRLQGSVGLRTANTLSASHSWRKGLIDVVSDDDGKGSAVGGRKLVRPAVCA